MLHLKGSCHCGAVAFEFDTHAPVPFMRCYCSICRKTSGGGGYTINIIGQTDSLKITRGANEIRSYRAVKNKDAPKEKQELCQNRYFCPTCASYLWAHCDDWPQWIYPYASAIDSELPMPKAVANIMLGSCANWSDPRVQPRKAADNEMFDEYPSYSLEQWHKDHGEHM
ncbi:S-glutathione synthase [Martensiomyces pterosporus]|nr:S-glutathione synthase [Martensiomyces pterosporus]